MPAPDFGAPSEELYPAALEMREFGDKLGIEGVIFPAHHASEDGHNPVPSLMASAVVARTKRMEIILGAVIRRRGRAGKKTFAPHGPGCWNAAGPN